MVKAVAFIGNIKQAFTTVNNRRFVYGLSDRSSRNRQDRTGREYESIVPVHKLNSVRHFNKMNY